MKMNKNRIANYISEKCISIISPLFLPTIAVYYLLHSIPGFEAYTPRLKYLVLLMYAIFTFMLPLIFRISFIHPKSTNQPHKIGMAYQLSLIITAIVSGIGYFQLNQFPIHHMLSQFLLLEALLLLIIVISYRKINLPRSLVSIGGLIGAFLAINFRYGINLIIPICLMILLAGILGSTNIQTNRHSQKDIYTGFSCSLVLAYLLFFFR